MTSSRLMCARALTQAMMQAAADKAPSVTAQTAETGEDKQLAGTAEERLAGHRSKGEDEESVDLDISDKEGGMEAGAEGQGSEVDEDWADWN